MSSSGSEVPMVGGIYLIEKHTFFYMLLIGFLLFLSRTVSRL